jgi:hypothetical protein
VPLDTFGTSSVGFVYLTNTSEPQLNHQNHAKSTPMRKMERITVFSPLLITKSPHPVWA